MASPQGLLEQLEHQLDEVGYGCDDLEGVFGVHGTSWGCFAGVSPEVRSSGWSRASRPLVETSPLTLHTMEEPLGDVLTVPG